MHAESLEFRGIEKFFGRTRALDPIALQLAASEFVTLLGPSGSGKTTLLNIAAGFLKPDGGSLHIGTQDVTALPARKRNIGMVFQNYALFPHMNVFENIAYGLRVRGVASTDIEARVRRALDGVRLGEYAERAIRQLSGGQQQRVALARALVIEPPVLLMDEPLGALDRQLRKQVQLEIRRLHREFGRTTLFVTHDQEEALAMSDRIAVMRGGRIEQIGRPNDLYQRPANVFVASFLGESNILNGTVQSLEGGVATVRIDGLACEVRGEAVAGVVPGQPAGALIRPEAIAISVAGEGLRAQLIEVVPLGEIVAMRLQLETGQEFWVRRFSGTQVPDAGHEVRLSWRTEDVRILPMQT